MSELARPKEVGDEGGGAPGGGTSCRRGKLELLEEDLGRLNGVVAGRVFTDGQGDITDVHILATRARSAKQIVRDVETLLRARYGLEVDYRRVSVVQLGDGPGPSEIQRPCLEEVQVRVGREHAQIRVLLRSGTSRSEGEASSGRSGRHFLRASAEAALAAVVGMLDTGEVQLYLNDVSTCTVANRDVVLATVSCSIAGQGGIYAGCAFMGEHPAEAAAKAVLDALNRPLNRLLQGRPVFSA